jgi:hypothetical protein
MILLVFCDGEVMGERGGRRWSYERDKGMRSNFRGEGDNIAT